MFGRILLFMIGLAFAPYGLMCLFDPLSAAEITGMQLHNRGALTEVAAMYGGLQFGLGALFIFCALRADFARMGLFVLVVVLGSLALGRIFGLMVYGGSAYNWSVLIFEALSGGLGILALRVLSRRSETSDAR